MAQQKLAILKRNHSFVAKTGHVIPAIKTTTMPRGIVFRSKEQWAKEKAARAAARKL